MKFCDATALKWQHRKKMKYCNLASNLQFYNKQGPLCKNNVRGDSSPIPQTTVVNTKPYLQ